MILKALYDYYQKLKDLGEVAPAGAQKKAIQFIIVIDSEGRLKTVEDTRDSDGKGKVFFVSTGSRTSKIVPNLFWDNKEYVLGLEGKVKVSGKGKDKQKIQDEHTAFIRKCQEIAAQNPDEPGFQAVCRFYEQHGEDAICSNEDIKKQILEDSNGNIAFQLQGGETIIGDNPKLFEYAFTGKDTSENTGICLVTGRSTHPVITTTATKISGSQATAKLVAFQVDSGYDSYGREKGENAPISKEAEHAYSTALNHLLADDSRNKFTVGSRTFVFWASSSSQAGKEAESALFSMLGMQHDDKSDQNSNVDSVREAFKAIYSGKTLSMDDDRFFILGLAPNAARIAVVYWNETTVKEFARTILRHFDDMEIGNPGPKPYYGLYQMLRAVTLKGKVQDVQPNLVEATVKSIFQGTPYPYSLYASCLERIRAEQSVWQVRATILKAYLTRLSRGNYKVSTMLDKTNTNQGYLCGRLLATIEKIQLEVQNNESNVLERYLNAASSTPVAVFATLLNLSVHHEGNLKKERKIFFTRLKQEIISKISADGFPAHLSLQDQGMFMIGYYQQRQDFFTPKSSGDDKQSEEQPAESGTNWEINFDRT